MKKMIAAALCFFIAFSMFGCARPVLRDSSEAIMIDGTVYYSTGRAIPVEPDDSAIRHTISYAENGIPSKDGEDNFNREAGTAYAIIDSGTVVVQIDYEWIEFIPED